MSLSSEISVFSETKTRLASLARQRAALQLLCGLDIEALLAAGPEGRRRALARIERAIERERMKAARGHWSYDLDRHIALAEARNAMRGEMRPRRAADHGALKAERRRKAPSRKTVGG